MTDVNVSYGAKVEAPSIARQRCKAYVHGIYVSSLSFRVLKLSRSATKKRTKNTEQYHKEKPSRSKIPRGLTLMSRLQNLKKTGNSEIVGFGTLRKKKKKDKQEEKSAGVKVN